MESESSYSGRVIPSKSRDQLLRSIVKLSANILLFARAQESNDLISYIFTSDV